MTYEQPTLPYSETALEPVISAETIRYHYGKHEKAYIDNLNRLIKGTEYEDAELEDIIEEADGALFNNASQAWNHIFYFFSFSPDGSREPGGELRKAIDRDFGSFDQLKAQMDKACASLFGSGWVWLVEDKSGKLAVMSEQNAGNPLRYGMKPLLAIDVWEHAYYIDYRNRRADSIAALWDRIDWKTVGERYDRK